jgi:hypothetical protein
LRGEVERGEEEKEGGERNNSWGAVKEKRKWK